MLKKKARILKGKQIRRNTGLPFPIAMRLGRALVSEGYISYEMLKRFPEYVKDTPLPCGIDCCGATRAIVGPRGAL